MNAKVLFYTEVHILLNEMKGANWLVIVFLFRSSFSRYSQLTSSTLLYK